MYQVLARKWRPQTLDEVVGQSHVVRTLRNALESKRLAHAYVLAGVRGTGKTTVARILAKGVNCVNGPTAAPCNRCVSCVEIAEGRSLDVMELDAASRTGVDNIRELQEVVAYSPVRDRYRVLIIDEAHMLSKAACNALLKTLEEPPAQVVFVHATTEIQKILPTILSRCQVFEFRRVSIREIAGHLKKVAAAEGITISDVTLDRIARAGEGSMRDALSVLERVLAFCGDRVADDEADLVLGTIRTEILVDFVKGIASRDAAALLASLDALVDEGHDLVHFWGEMVAVVRDLMLLAAWPDGAGVLTRSEDETKTLRAAGASLTLEDWTRVFQVLAALELPLKTSSQPRYMFEGALIRIAGLGAVRPIEEILARLQGASTETASTPASRSAASRPAPAPQKKNLTPPAAPAERADLIAPPPPPSSAGRTAGGIDDIRGALIAAVAGPRPMLAALLEQAESIAIDGGSLAVTFGPGGEGLRRMLAGDGNAKAIEEIAAATFGRPLALAVAGPADGAAPPRRDLKPAAGASIEKPAAPAAPVSLPADDGDSRGALNERARRDPAVSRVLREFGAQIIDVRELRTADEEHGQAAIEDGA